MADELGAPTPVRIITDVPILFADGVISQVYGPGISKFYFGRVDPDPAAQKPGTSVPVAQVVMPAEGFADMVAFLDFRLATMVAEGVVSKEYVEKAKKKWSK